MFDKFRKNKLAAEQAKLRSIRTLLNAYDSERLDREHLEAGLTHLFLPMISKTIHAVLAVRTKAEEALGRRTT